jgi:hypothetical protein
MTVPGLSGQYSEMPREYPTGGDPYHPEHARGWLRFAGIMLGVVGVLNIVWGIAALDDSQVFTHDAKYVVFDSLHTWGWIVLILGVVQLFAAASIFRGGTFGAVVGIVCAALNMFSNLFSLRAHPAWAITVIALDLLIIYALSVYGGRGSRTGTA